MKDRRPGRYEHLIVYRTSNQVRIRADQTMAANARGMATGAAYNGILHHDAAVADFDSTTFSDDRSAMHDSTARADSDITADRRRGCNVSAWINARRVPEMREEHLVCHPVVEMSMRWQPDVLWSRRERIARRL